MDKLKELIGGNNPYSLVINVVMMLVIAGGIIAGFFYIYLPSTTQHSETITVPDVTGMTYQEAAKVLAKHSLRFAIYDSGAVNYRSDVPANTVLSHTPGVNAKVKENRKIYFRINPSRPPAVNMPDLFDSSLKNAYVRLRNLGLTIGEIERVPDRSGCSSCVNTVLQIVYKGKEVSKEQVDRGFKVLKGSTVNLVVSDGLGNTTTEVPNLIGMPYDEAEFALIGMGLGVGRVKYVESDTLAGVVLKQSPNIVKKSQNEEGEEKEEKAYIRLGRVIDLWVSEHSLK